MKTKKTLIKTCSYFINDLNSMWLGVSFSLVELLCVWHLILIQPWFCVVVFLYLEIMNESQCRKNKHKFRIVLHLLLQFHVVVFCAVWHQQCRLNLNQISARYKLKILASANTSSRKAARRRTFDSISLLSFPCSAAQSSCLDVSAITFCKWCV